jgi:ATP-dependent helicase/nuclease subunit A
MRARIGARADPDPVYAWLGKLELAEEMAELGRLLYVGATRAKQRLHWLAVAELETNARADGEPPGWKRPARGSALERLWNAIGAQIPPAPQADGVASNAAAQATPSQLARLPVAWQLPALPEPLPVGRHAVSIAEEPVFDWADATAAAIGTAAHRLLAQIAVEGLSAWEEPRVVAQRSRILAELGSEGVEHDLRGSAAQRVIGIVTRTLRDPRGRWLFDPAHVDAHSEWAVAGEDEGRIVHVVLDRSFVTGGWRYIVDFKTGAHLGGDPKTFLQREFERYRPQLARYARLVRAIDPRPVRIALYHPLVEGGWQEHELPD